MSTSIVQHPLSTSQQVRVPVALNDTKTALKVKKIDLYLSASGKTAENFSRLPETGSVVEINLPTTALDPASGPQNLEG